MLLSFSIRVMIERMNESNQIHQIDFTDSFDIKLSSSNPAHISLWHNKITIKMLEGKQAINFRNTLLHWWHIPFEPVLMSVSVIIKYAVIKNQVIVLSTRPMGKNVTYNRNNKCNEIPQCNLSTQELSLFTLIMLCSHTNIGTWYYFKITGQLKIRRIIK